MLLLLRNFSLMFSKKLLPFRNLEKLLKFLEVWHKVIIF